MSSWTSEFVPDVAAYRQRLATAASAAVAANVAYRRELAVQATSSPMPQQLQPRIVVIVRAACSHVRHIKRRVASATTSVRSYVARRLKERDGPANYRDEPTTTTTTEHRPLSSETDSNAFLCPSPACNRARPTRTNVSTRPNRQRRHATATTRMTTTLHGRTETRC